VWVGGQPKLRGCETQCGITHVSIRHQDASGTVHAGAVLISKGGSLPARARRSALRRARARLINDETSKAGLLRFEGRPRDPERVSWRIYEIVELEYWIDSSGGYALHGHGQAEILAFDSAKGGRGVLTKDKTAQPPLLVFEGRESRQSRPC
jgi:hypothetical protein